MSASLAVQKALYAALAGIAPVYDGPPADAAPPYLTIGPDAVRDAGTKDAEGREHRVRVTAWSATPGSAEAKALAGRAEAAVLALAGTVDGWRIVSARFARGFVDKDVDGWTQAVGEFRVRTERA